MRVSYPWAGSNWGAIHIPRIGQEVIVDFLEGDPDCPIVTGCVYNAEQMPPWELPGNKTQSGILTRSTAKGASANCERHPLRGQEGLRAAVDPRREEPGHRGRERRNPLGGHDRKKTIDHDETTHVKHDRTETVDNNETITIGVNRTESVGSNETISIGANRTETVGANETITIGANRTEAVIANETITIGSNRSITVSGSETKSVALQRTHTVGVNETIALAAHRKSDRCSAGRG